MSDSAAYEAKLLELSKRPVPSEPFEVIAPPGMNLDLYNPSKRVPPITELERVLNGVYYYAYSTTVSTLELLQRLFESVGNLAPYYSLITGGYIRVIETTPLDPLGYVRLSYEITNLLDPVEPAEKQYRTVSYDLYGDEITKFDVTPPVVEIITDPSELIRRMAFVIERWSTNDQLNPWILAELFDELVKKVDRSFSCDYAGVDKFSNELGENQCNWNTNAPSPDDYYNSSSSEDAYYDDGGYP